MITPARKIGDNLYAIPSFSEDREFIVNLELNSCSCPHFQYRLAGTNRGDCKHLTAVKDQAPRIELLEKAARCTDEQLGNLLAKYGAADAEIGGALRVEREKRRAAADNEAKLKAIFA